MSARNLIDSTRLPAHIAVIMDGNGRWAKQHGKLRTFGHRHGVEAVRDTVEGAAELGIKYLTLYAFSTENWNRPQAEVSTLMELLVTTITKETKTLMDNNIRLTIIGDVSSFSQRVSRNLKQAMDTTAGNTRMTLVLALSYSSRWEITNAVKAIAAKAANGSIDPSAVSEKVIEQHLCTAGLPDPELLIRTSGEHRISNYLLWQIAYAELYFTPVLWPDFRRAHLYEAIIDFQKRERRFGMVSEQLTRHDA